MIGAIAYNNKTYTKGYEVNQRNNPIKVSGTLVKGHEYNFHTFVQLRNEMPYSSSMLELNLNTEIELDINTNKYVLKNARLEITPFGCRQYAKVQQYVNEDQYSQNYQFGVEPNETFNQTMAIGYAKLLLNNNNIKINKVSSADSHPKINSIGKLKAAKDNSANVTVDYSYLDQYYTQWFNIKFNIISEKEGIFTVS